MKRLEILTRQPTWVRVLMAISLTALFSWGMWAATDLLQKGIAP